jgi:hypothetical protein
LGVVGGLGAGAVDDEVVAAGFALEAHARGDVPGGRVEEEEGLRDRLKEVDEVVVAADVGELVGEDGAELVGGKAGDESGRCCARIGGGGWGGGCS